MTTVPCPFLLGQLMASGHQAFNNVDPNLRADLPRCSDGQPQHLGVDGIRWDSMGRWWWLVLACQRLLKTVSQLPVLTRSTLMFTNITNFQSLGINVCPPRLRMLGHVEMSMPSYIRSTRGTGKAAKSSVFELRLFCSSKQRIIGCIGEPVRLTVPWLSIRMRVRKVLWKGSNWLSTESLSRITKHDKHWSTWAGCCSKKRKALRIKASLGTQVWNQTPPPPLESLQLRCEGRNVTLRWNALDLLDLPKDAWTDIL